MRAGEHIQAAILLASIAMLSGCRSPAPSQSPERAVHVVLCQSNEVPLANLHMVLPTAIPIYWTNGIWKGLLAPTYVRPAGDRHLLASDLLNGPSWRELICRVDPDDANYIRINLQPDNPMDHINVWIPVQRKSSSKSNWHHWTDAGGAEGGTATLLDN